MPTSVASLSEWTCLVASRPVGPWNIIVQLGVFLSSRRAMRNVIYIHTRLFFYSISLSFLQFFLLSLFFLLIFSTFKLSTFPIFDTRGTFSIWAMNAQLLGKPRTLALVGQLVRSGFCSFSGPLSVPLSVLLLLLLLLLLCHHQTGRIVVSTETRCSSCGIIFKTLPLPDFYGR